MPEITIIIPHKPRPSNDRALQLAITSIIKNTNCTYELIIDPVVPGDPYVIWNDVSKHARGETLVFSNSDVMFAEWWDVLMLKHCAPNTIVTGYIIEPGNIGVAPVNISRDFGKHPDNFDQVSFQKYVDKVSQKVEDVKEERGWYMPCAMNRDWFLSTGGFNVEKSFPNPNDIEFWERCKERYGTKFLRVKSYSYHFQNQSGRD